MECERIIRKLLDVLHPGVVGLIYNNHGEAHGQEAIEAVQAAKDYLASMSGQRDATGEDRTLRAALERLLNSDPTGAIATASDDVLRHAAADMAAGPVIREQAASVLQARETLRSNGRSTGMEVFSGYLSYENIHLQVDFDAPAGASIAEKDSAFLAALAQQVNFDYMPVGDDMGASTSVNRNVFTEAFLARCVSSSGSPEEVIRIRRDLVAQELLGTYPEDTIISRDLYDEDPLLGPCLAAMNPIFEFPNWEGITIGAFCRKYGIDADPACMNVIQISAPQPNKDGVKATNITLQDLWDAHTLGEAGWQIPSGIEVWFHHQAGTSTCRC